MTGDQGSGPVMATGWHVLLRNNIRKHNLFNSMFWRPIITMHTDYIHVRSVHVWISLSEKDSLTTIFVTNGTIVMNVDFFMIQVAATSQCLTIPNLPFSEQGILPGISIDCSYILGTTELIVAWWLHMATQRSGSTLAQVMACCLTTPSHYLNQWWLIISEA